MSTLRAGVVGLGQMGRHHVRVLDQMDGIELVGVADAQGDRFGAARGGSLCGDVEELLALGLDLCVVAVPTDHHEPVAARLAEAGVHALVEKPLAPDLETAGRLVEAFESRGLIGAVGHIERFNPALQALRTRLESGELGEIFQIATRRQGPFPPRIQDVGVIFDLATHDIDITGWVAGATFASIAAQTAHKTGRTHEDLVAATGALSTGVVTNHLVNWLTPTKERVTVVTGERGCFVADTLTADLTFFANGDAVNRWEAMSQFRGVSEGDVVRYAIARPEPLSVELTAFVEAVRTGEIGRAVGMRDGLAAVAVAEAMLESSRSGRTVELAHQG